MRPGACVHFTGIQHPTCKAGIDYKTVRDDSQPGPYRWPCLTLASGAKATTMCSCYREPTAQEVAEFDAAIDAAVAKIAEREKRGECNACGVKVQAVRQVGRCVYADPCGHRQGQGSAKRFADKTGVALLPPDNSNIDPFDLEGGP